MPSGPVDESLDLAMVSRTSSRDGRAGGRHPFLVEKGGQFNGLGGYFFICFCHFWGQVGGGGVLFYIFLSTFGDGGRGEGRRPFLVETGRNNS